MCLSLHERAERVKPHPRRKNVFLAVDFHGWKSLTRQVSQVTIISKGILQISGWTILLVTVACLGGNDSTVPATRTPTPIERSPVLTPVSTPTPVVTEPVWNVYDPDRQHLWNRVFHLLYDRKTTNGVEYGRDSLDPLYWSETTYLLEGASHEPAIQLLDEFLTTNGKTLMTDPLKRAMFQRDLWAIFEWLAYKLAFNPIDYLDQGQALQVRLAQIMRRVALTQEEIHALPDNYLLAVRSQVFAKQFSEQTPETAFLPPDLFSSTGGWVLLGREGGLMAEAHLQYPFSGRSTFLVFLRVPGGRQATLDYFNALREAKSYRQAPYPPPGTEVALVRRMMLIDQSGSIVLSPVVESIQLRHFTESRGQVFYEFTVNRELLFANQSGGFYSVKPGDRDFPLFFSHGVDWFEFAPEEIEQERPETLQTCPSCHLGNGASGTASILSFSRFRFDLEDQPKVVLNLTTPEAEARQVIEWKLKQNSWQELQNLWSDSLKNE